MTRPMSITVYYVGEDESAALEGLPFDSFESAESYQRDTGEAHVFSVTATIDPSTIERVK